MSAKIRAVMLTFSNGETWEVDALPIAVNRADYYATKVDGFARGSDDWKAEVDTALEDAYELGDWARNNMNWSDVQPYARKVGAATCDYQREWVNAEMTYRFPAIAPPHPGREEKTP